jgi:hypothetical protein
MKFAVTTIEEMNHLMVELFATMIAGVSSMKIV